MKTKSIDELLSWAFVHELPKGGGVDGLDNGNSAWRGIMAGAGLIKFQQLGTRVSEGHHGEYDNFLLEQGEPHEDAVTIGQAVAGLARCEVVIPKSWDPLPDWPDHDARMPALKAEAVARAVERFTLRSPGRRAQHLMSLVVGTAVLGREPAWDAPVSAIRMVERMGQPAWFVRRQVKDEFGRVHEIEVDGYNRRAGRPLRGAYRKFALSDDPVGDILARLDRELWVAALDHVAGEAANRLVAHRLRETGIEARPWGGVGPAIALLTPQDVASRKTA